MTQARGPISLSRGSALGTLDHPYLTYLTRALLPPISVSKPGDFRVIFGRSYKQEIRKTRSTFFR